MTMRFVKTITRFNITIVYSILIIPMYRVERVIWNACTPTELHRVNTCPPLCLAYYIICRAIIANFRFRCLHNRTARECLNNRGEKKTKYMYAWKFVSSSISCGVRFYKTERWVRIIEKTIKDQLYTVINTDLL